MRSLLKYLSFQVFKFGQRFGVNITPNHYYVPLADIHRLRKTRQIWAKPSKLVGIDVDIDAQVEALRTMVLPYKAEYAQNKAYLEGVAARYGPGYGPINAQALAGMLRHLKPKRIIEVGSGVSTYCMLKATEDHPAQVICIEPYPREILKTLGVTLHETPVEYLDPEFFEQLDSGDFLFIDSSHAVRLGGDVLFLYLEVLPRLKPGVYVYIDDIYLPYAYPHNVLETYMQWAETAILQALLVNNRKLKIVFSMSMLHFGRPEVLREVLPCYRPAKVRDGIREDKAGHFPNSIYLLTV
jgi:predicted O-methyltransferase YrrM